MGKALVPHTIIGCCRTIVNQLHRLTGGELRIRRFQISHGDNNFVSDGFVKLRFTNRGQLTAVIDESIYLLPGESFVEGDDVGPGINHKYQIRFLEPAGPTPDDDKAAEARDNYSFTIPGALLQVRVMVRNY